MVARAPSGCASAAQPASTFFTAAISGTGCGLCALVGGARTTGCLPENCAAGCREDPALNNDFFGCGLGRGYPTTGGCEGMNRFSGNACGDIGAPWDCTGGGEESRSVRKTAPDGGGVLCCR